jgi:hypothetical protein
MTVAQLCPTSIVFLQRDGSLQQFGTEAARSVMVSIMRLPLHNAYAPIFFRYNDLDRWGNTLSILLQIHT